MRLAQTSTDLRNSQIFLPPKVLDLLLPHQLHDKFDLIYTNKYTSATIVLITIMILDQYDDSFQSQIIASMTSSISMRKWKCMRIL